MTSGSSSSPGKNRFTAELACPIGLKPASFIAAAEGMVGRVVSGTTVDCDVLEEEGGCEAGGGIAAGGGLGAETYIIRDNVD